MRFILFFFTAAVPGVAALAQDTNLETVKDFNAGRYPAGLLPAGCVR